LKENKDFLNYVETEFKCSGVCTPAYVYYFSDSNAGPPKDYPKNKGCYVEVYNSIEKIITTIVLPLWLFCGFFFLNLVFGCCLVCHPKREEFTKESVSEGESK